APPLNVVVTLGQQRPSRASRPGTQLPRVWLVFFCPFQRMTNPPTNRSSAKERPRTVESWLWGRTVANRDPLLDPRRPDRGCGPRQDFDPFSCDLSVDPEV